MNNFCKINEKLLKMMLGLIKNHRFSLCKMNDEWKNYFINDSLSWNWNSFRKILIVFFFELAKIIGKRNSYTPYKYINIYIKEKSLFAN